MTYKSISLTTESVGRMAIDLIDYEVNKGSFIVMQLNSTRCRVELSCVVIDTLTGSRRSELIGDSCSRCERVFTL